MISNKLSAHKVDTAAELNKMTQELTPAVIKETTAAVQQKISTIATLTVDEVVKAKVSKATGMIEDSVLNAKQRISSFALLTPK